MRVTFKYIGSFVVWSAMMNLTPVDAIQYDNIHARTPILDRNPLNITAQKGQTVVLPCAIRYLGKHKVVWIDEFSTLLTFDDRRIIDDAHMSIERPSHMDWNLIIRDVQTRHTGDYTCQINTQPIQTKQIHLTVATETLLPSTLTEMPSTPTRPATTALPTSQTTSSNKKSRKQQRLDLEERKLDALTRSAAAQEKIVNALQMIATLLNKNVS